MKQFFNRKIFQPILGFLKEGISPDKIAMCIAFGFVLGVIPFVGITTLLCAIVAIVFRLNMGVIQIMNYAVYPLQILLFIPFVKTGIYLFDDNPLSFSSDEIIEMIKENAFQVVIKLGYANILGVIVWLILAPVLFAVIYYLSYYLLSRSSFFKL
ncbi:MAG: DUF2062 domain-containing protein [Cyclobacteriaceae bacterium]|nr:DUF2062 domain-containing protein [Cyclobacteriaceae bacterium]